MVNYGFPWFTLDYHGLPFTMDYYGLPWFTFLWFTMAYYGFLWFTVAYHGILWFTDVISFVVPVFLPNWWIRTGWWIEIS